MSDAASPRHEDIDLSEHAVERYRARQPALDHAGARAELGRLVPSGEVLPAAPEWTRSAAAKPFCLVIGDNLALPLAAQNGRWVTACLVKTTLIERRREQRARQKARRASAKRARRRASW
jgi:hypothetical protein